MMAPGIALLAVLGLGSQAPSATEILERARAAAAALERTRHHAVVSRSLVLANRIWRAEGMVLSDSGDEPRLRVEGEVRTPETGEGVTARLARDGARWTFVDDSAGIWCTGADARLGGDESWLLAGLALDALPGDPPYAGERATGLSGPRGLEAGEFWVLETESADGTRSSTWYLETSDLLPRQCDRTTRLDRGEELVERILHGEVEELDATAWTPLAAPGDFARLEPRSELSITPWLEPRIERDVAVTPLSGSIDPLREAFAAASGKPRVVGLFAPT